MGIILQTIVFSPARVVFLAAQAATGARGVSDPSPLVAALHNVCL